MGRLHILMHRDHSIPIGFMVLRSGCGKRKLQAVFDGKLDQILEQFNDYMWEQLA